MSLKKYLSILSIFISILLPTTIRANSLNDLVNEVLTAVSEGDNVTVVRSSNELMDKFLDDMRFDDAYKLALKISQATHPTMARHGYLLFSKYYIAAYHEVKQPNLLLDAAYMTILSGGSEESNFKTISLLAEMAGEDAFSFYEKAKEKAKNYKLDLIINESINHITNGRWELARKYIEGGLVDVNHQMSSDGASFLAIAAWHGDLAVVKDLVEELGADINIRSHKGETPLQFAVDQQNYEVAAYLKSKGGTL
jgi:hypothetical protein